MVVPIASVKQRCGALMRLTCLSGIFLGSNFTAKGDRVIIIHSWSFVNSSWRFPQVCFDECRTNSPSIKNCYRKKSPTNYIQLPGEISWLTSFTRRRRRPPQKGLKFLRVLKQNNQRVQFLCCAWRKKKNANSIIPLINAQSLKLPHQPTNLTNSNSPSGKSVNIHGVA